MTIHELLALTREKERTLRREQDTHGLRFRRSLLIHVMQEIQKRNGRSSRAQGAAAAALAVVLRDMGIRGA